MKAFVLAMGLIAGAMTPALAEGRYGFRCTITESGSIQPADHTMKEQFFSLDPEVHVFVIDPDKGVWRERFLGSDGPAQPFTITREEPAGSRAGVPEGDLSFTKNIHVWLTGEFAGMYSGLWTEDNPKGFLPGVKIYHASKGHCEEVADIPNVDLPSKSIVDKAKTFLGAMR